MTRHKIDHHDSKVTLTGLLDSMFEAEPISRDRIEQRAGSFQPLWTYSKDGMVLVTLGSSTEEEGDWVLAEPSITWPHPSRPAWVFEPHCTFSVHDPENLADSEIEYVTRKAQEIASRRRSLHHPCSACHEVFGPGHVDDNFEGRVVCHGCMSQVYGVVF